MDVAEVSPEKTFLRKKEPGTGLEGSGPAAAPVKAYNSPRAQQHPPRHLRPAPRYFPVSLLFPSFSEWMGVQYSRVRGHSGTRKVLVWVLDMQIVF